MKVEAAANYGQGWRWLIILNGALIESQSSYKTDTLALRAGRRWAKKNLKGGRYTDASKP